jgi:hypothetical protein
MVLTRRRRGTACPSRRRRWRARQRGGNTLPYEDVLAPEGVTDFDAYGYVPSATPQVDLFVDHV